ncbi:hypothetical protein [Wenyingzhuangia sp. IMCC45574]
MKKYNNISGQSDIDFFQIGDEYIIIKLSKTGEELKYSYENTGKNKVEKMKSLAIRGSGLWRYILTNAKKVHDLGITKRRFKY